LLSLSGIEGKPHDLLVTALVRARMCEELARTIGREDTADIAFTTGLFSVMDALADAPLEEVLANLPLADEIVAALREGADVPGALLSAVVAYERGDADAAEAALPAEAPLAPTYLDALAWSEAALTGITP
jgi:EAL and modified HD-GYP domain-containing signal transduction protein